LIRHIWTKFVFGSVLDTFKQHQRASYPMFKSVLWRFTTPVSVALFFCMIQSPVIPAVQAQEAGLAQATALVVDGNVENVFQADDEYLVQILVQRSEVPRIDRGVAARYPAPGEYVYAHVGSARYASERRALPRPQMRVRAFLSVGQAGQWEAVGRDWYQENPGDRNDVVVDRASITIGLSTQPVTLGRSTALKVVQVTPDSPAAKAGIEPGDVLVEANRVALSSEQQLQDAVRNSRGKLALTVRDVRSGRDVVVDVESVGVSLDPNLRPGMVAKLQPLGVTTALAFYDGEPAVKVTDVKAGSAAQRAGIAAGLLIVKANGKPVTSPEVLRDAEAASRGSLELEIVDPSDRRQRVVQVRL
jgi:hypothetical protein